jgi:hypothetical protein
MLHGAHLVMDEGARAAGGVSVADGVLPEKNPCGPTDPVCGDELLLHLPSARAVPQSPPQRCAPGRLISVHRQRGVVGDPDEFELETFEKLLDDWA